MASPDPPANGSPNLGQGGRCAEKYITFYLVTTEGELWFGQSIKGQRQMTLDDYREALELVPDEEIYPVIPTDAELTIAPDDLDGSFHIKRPGLTCYETMKGPFVMKSVLDETMIMEKISKTQHPNIVKYHGCQVRRGRITSIVLKKYDFTLSQYIREPGFQQLDKDKFVDALESVVGYIHSLGLAHNDINPDNIMMGEDGLPVLIDFGSCAPCGQTLQSLGTEGRYEKSFFTSEKDHDDFALRKMRTWIHNPEHRA